MMYVSNKFLYFINFLKTHFYRLKAVKSFFSL